MARPRKPSGKGRDAAPQPRPKPKRDSKAAYARRDARARALGYASYADYRLHLYGKLPPGPLEITSEERSKRRGHRGTADFLRELGEGDLIIMPEGLSAVERDAQGRYVRIVKLVIDAENGRERTYTLRNLTRAELEATIAEEERKGAIFSPSPSLDQRRLLDWKEAA